MIYAFHGHTLDVKRRELRRGSEPIAVEPQVFDLLLHLIGNRDRVVSKDDLIATVWNGRAISDSALSSRITAARQAVGDTGEHQAVIRTVARKGFRFVGDVLEKRDHDTAVHAVGLSEANGVPLEWPSIAVLPFQNLSEEAGQEYFADGMVEEIIVGLSRSPALSVISPWDSSFTYKGRTVDVKQVGRDLGVRYVMEGSVRRAANQVRITGRLVDAASGAHLWAERFHGTLEDIFDLQDEITTNVVGAIASKLEQAEIARAKRKPPASLHAYDYFLRGMASYYEGQGNRAVMDEALALFRKAIALDPGFALAYSTAAACYGWRKANLWIADYPKECAEAAALARRGAELGPDDAIALARSGMVLAFVALDIDRGVTLVDRALILNPNLSTTWWTSAWVRIYCGEPDKAIEHFTRAMRLSPLDPQLHMLQAGIAFAHMLAGRYTDACVWASKATSALSTFVPAIRYTAASNALAGQMDTARAAMAQLRKLDPAMRIANLKYVTPLRRPEDLARLEEGLRLAGLPET